MEWNEIALFEAWKGKQPHSQTDQSWSQLVRLGSSSSLMQRVSNEDQESIDEFDKDACQLVDKILWEHWDPLRVNKLSACRNEYHGFAWDVSHAAVVGSRIELVAELYALERHYFNIDNPDTLERAHYVADKLRQILVKELA